MTASTQGIKISNIHLLNPPISWKGDPKLEIKITFISKAATNTQSAVGIKDQDNNINRMIWKEPFIFTGDITENSLLTFTVQSKRVIKNIIVGSCERRVTDLLEQQGDSGPCKLDVIGECQLTLGITQLSELDLASEMVKQGPGSLPNLEVSSQVATAIDSSEQVYNDNVKTWVSFLDTFEAFMKVMDKVSEISIYVQVAWSVLSIIPKTIIAKKNRDDKVKQLCEKLKDIFEYVTDVETYCKLTATRSAAKSTAHWSTMLSTLVQQTIECAHFLKAYSTESIAKNILIVKAIGGGVDAKIQAFNDKLEHLIKVMTTSVILETGIVALRVAKVSEEDTDKITKQYEHTLLEEMPYDRDAGYYPNKECLPGTRQRLINDIFKWAINDTSTQILVLSGQAGKGKSAVAHTIAKMFKAQNRLGSMFCFNRSYAGRRNRLFSTISRNLADGDIMWRKELIKVIEKDSDVRKKEDVRTQFNELIIKPSQNVATDNGPVVIVVDALDESGDREERKEILEILFNEWTKLPKNYRMFVTTRPEQDIEDKCQEFDIPHKRMDEVDGEETHRDIEAFVSNRLKSISSILDSIDRNWCSILAERAEGLFQWAQTVCQEVIKPTITRPQLVKKKWEAFNSNSPSSLYGLYRQIISSQAEIKDGDFVEDFKTIVGAITTARRPLSINALQNIFDDIEDIKSILTPFGSFFVGVHDLSTPVRPVHTSLFDFFISKNMAEEINEYYIDTSDQSRMTLGCLKVMNRMLCFNICQLETSHLLNEEVPNFKARVEKSIPSHLSYSCLHWFFHLQSSPVSEELIREIRRLMDDGLLYYFEAFSLLSVSYGCETMQEIARWCEGTDDSLAADATDACRFGKDFEYMMRESTPHIYLSALPFTSRDSFVSKKYLDKYPGLFTFDIGQPVSSSRPIGIAQRVWSKSIAFSPNDTYIATESRRGELLLWNYMTGEHLAYWKAGWARDHEDSRVCDIVYSLDGESVYCCFYDGDILVWNTGTKETKIERYGEIVGDDECENCAISSDGRFIIWEMKKDVLVIDRKSRQIVKRFGEEYSFSAISPNGNWIALYGGRKVYIWDTRNQTQHCVIPGNHGRRLSLTDSCIAFEQDEATIEIWDLQTITKLTKIRRWKYIRSLLLSPDDQYLLVISYRTYSIWSVSMGELLSQHYVDDPMGCRLLGFSHDSKSIALYTDVDHTVHIQQWVEHIDPRSNDLERVSEIWLRGSYLILHYRSVGNEHRLQISDVSTTNSIIFEAGLEDTGPVSVAPDEENVHVAYLGHRGLCLWDVKEGEIIVDGSVRSITALLCLDNYLIYGSGKTINIWDICTKMTHGPINLLYELESLLPVRGTRFAVIYDDKVEIWDCDSGDSIGRTSTFENQFYAIAVSVNEKHVICMSENDIDILDPTGANVNSFPFSPYYFLRKGRPRRSLNGKYMAWTDYHKIKLFDVDTETLLVGPSFDQPVEDFWLSDNSKYIITAFSVGDRGQRPICLDIWDIQSENMITKTIQLPCLPQTAILDLCKRRLIVIPEECGDCYVWDLDKYQIMSSVYNARQHTDDDSDIEGTSISSKKETLDYASMGWGKASLPTLPEVNESTWARPAREFTGWVLGLQGERLFCIPEKLRRGFWFSCTTHTPYRNITKLNFTNFVHGSDWTKCKSGND